MQSASVKCSQSAHGLLQWCTTGDKGIRVEAKAVNHFLLYTLYHINLGDEGKARLRDEQRGSRQPLKPIVVLMDLTAS